MGGSLAIGTWLFGRRFIQFKLIKEKGALKIGLSPKGLGTPNENARAVMK